MKHVAFSIAFVATIIGAVVSRWLMPESDLAFGLGVLALFVLMAWGD